MVRLAIALGGAAGALARHGAAVTLSGAAGAGFPWGTLAVNVAGSWLLGLLMQIFGTAGAATSPALRAGLTVGFCAGFTTFSTFAYEAVVLVRSGRPWAALAYVTISLVLGLAAVAAGIGTGAAVLPGGTRRPAAPDRSTPRAARSGSR